MCKSKTPSTTIHIFLSEKRWTQIKSTEETFLVRKNRCILRNYKWKLKIQADAGTIHRGATQKFEIQIQ